MSNPPGQIPCRPSANACWLPALLCTGQAGSPQWGLRFISWCLTEGLMPSILWGINFLRSQGQALNHPIRTDHDDSSEVRCGENSEPEGKEWPSLAWESAPLPPPHSHLLQERIWTGLSSGMKDRVDGRWGETLALRNFLWHCSYRSWSAWYMSISFPFKKLPLETLKSIVV